MASKLKKFAVFDIDGTVVRTSLFLQIVDELIALGHLPSRLRADIDTKLEVYQTRKTETAFSDYAQLSVNALFTNLNTVKVSDYHTAVDAVVERTKDHTYVFTRQLIDRLRQQGYMLIALSGSEMYAVQQFTKYHGFDIAIGENYKQKNGIFTGEIESVIYNKDAFLNELIVKHDLDLTDSLAIGDSDSDSKILRLVDNPIAFNPEKALFETAKKQGWKIVLERKNVIYELEPSDGSYKLKA